MSRRLALTAGGLRRAQNPRIGIDVTALVRNKGEHIESKPIWCSPQTREQLRRYIARERSKLDPEGRTGQQDLDDSAPIFLSRRKRQLGYSGFGIVFKRLLRNAQQHFASELVSIQLVLPIITPHAIRHVHTTFRVKKVRELFSTPAERERALEALVDDLGWRSAEMLKKYDHAITKAELKELVASSIRQMLDDAPHDAASLQPLLGRTKEVADVRAEHDVRNQEHTHSDEARQTLAWIDALVDK